MKFIDAIKNESFTRYDLAVIIVGFFLILSYILNVFGFLLSLNDSTLLYSALNVMNLFCYIFPSISVIYFIVRISFVIKRKPESFSFRSLTFMLFLGVTIGIQVFLLLNVWIEGEGLFFSNYFEKYNFILETETPLIVSLSEILADTDTFKLQFGYSLILGVLIGVSLFMFIFINRIFDASSKTFYEYIEDEVTFSRLMTNKNYFFPYIILLTFLIMILIRVAYIFLGIELNLPLFMYSLSGLIGFGGTMLFFPTFAFYSNEKMFLKINQDWTQLRKANIQKDSEKQSSLFRLIQNQINANDSFLLHFSIVFVFLSIFWLNLSVDAFFIDLGNAIFILSIYYSLSILIPYNYCNFYIRKNSFEYVVEYSLFKTSSTVREVLAYRNIILSILVPLSGIIAFLLTNG